MRRSSIVFAFICGLAGSASPAFASDFTVVEKRILSENDVLSNPICNVRLSGPIVAGDAARLNDTLTSLAKEMNGNEFVGGFTICLNSPGGSYDEGLAIARVVLEKSIRTMIEARADCYSACALIFMSGNKQVEQYLFHERRLNLTGRLGFHAPYLSAIPDANYSSTNIGRSFESAIHAIGNLLKLGKEHKIKLLSSDILAEMLEKGPGEAFMIDTVYKAINSRIDLYSDSGISPPITQAALCNACENHFADSHGFDVDNPPKSCSALGVRIHKDQTWFGGYGAEGLGFCVVKVPGMYGARFGVYNEIAYEGQKALDQNRFISLPWYALAPSTHIGY
jgi:hypothetical protein